jgi:TonB family protein
MPDISFNLISADQENRSYKILLLFFFLAALLHALFFQLDLDWLKTTWHPVASPPPVELQNIDPTRLQQIKRQWKDKSLLVDRDPNAARSDTAPENARYFSDRNIRVDREQRASESSPVVRPQNTPPQAKATHPTPEKSSPSHQESHKKTQIKLKASSAGSHPLPDLKNLGIQLPFQQKDRTLAQASSPPSSHQWINDRELPTGSQNFLNAQESVYYSFYSRIYDAIGPIWQQLRHHSDSSHLQEQDYTTILDVVLDESGKLVHVNQLQSSGVRDFDDSAKQSWYQLEKFPNPPRGLLNSENQIHMGWNFTIQVRRGLSLGSSRRTY